MLCRLKVQHAATKLGATEPVIITALNSFHGRTLATITAMERRCGELALRSEEKAEKAELDEMVQLNEAINARVEALKRELSTTLVTLQTFVIESKPHKPHAIKLQVGPPARSA